MTFRDLRWDEDFGNIEWNNRGEPASIAGGVLLPWGCHGLDGELMDVVLDHGVREGDAWAMHDDGWVAIVRVREGINK